jgi:hypothetical protein
VFVFLCFFFLVSVFSVCVCVCMLLCVLVSEVGQRFPTLRFLDLQAIPPVISFDLPEHITSTSIPDVCVYMRVCMCMCMCVRWNTVVFVFVCLLVCL